MSGFAALFLLALLWAALTEEFTLANLVVGAALAFAVLGVSQRASGPAGIVRKLPRGVWFAAFFLRELLRANLRVAHDVVTPRYHMRPGVIAVPLDARTEVEITTLANLISLTPGTLSLDLSADRRVLFVYFMFLDDPDTLIREIKDGLERPLLELLR